jgi:beta-galactosidase
VLEGWDIYPMPMKAPDKLEFNHESCLGPCFYEGTFTVGKIADTFLDMHTIGKGSVWINGHAIGRFWDIGPQQTLYVPGAWLKVGENEIVVFNLKSKGPFAISGLDHPVLDGPVHETE